MGETAKQICHVLSLMSRRPGQQPGINIGVRIIVIELLPGSYSVMQVMEANFIP